jgi:hypothetical protein
MLKNPKKADLDKDGKLSSYEKKRGKAIEANMKAKRGKMMKAKKGVMAEEDNLSKYVREIKLEKKPKGAKRLSDEVKKKNIGGEMKSSKGYGAARTSGMGLQDEQLVPGKSLDYYKDLM